MHTFLTPAGLRLACAFLARVLRITRASLDRVLSKTAAASLRSYSRGVLMILTTEGLGPPQGLSAAAFLALVY